MSASPNVIIEEFHAGKDSVIIFYTTVWSKDVIELEITKQEAALLMQRSGWLDEVNIYNDIVMVRFETIYDDVNHSGNHVQRVQKVYIEWDDFRLWIVEREVRDIVKLYLKDQNQNNGIDHQQSGSDQE